MVYPKSRLSVFFVLMILFAVADLPRSLTTSAYAQSTLGGITGTVTDPQGSVIPGVEVTAISVGTSLTRKATSNNDGAYSFVNLPIGTYTLTFKRDGFAQEKFPGISVQADRTITLPASLKVGGLTDNVEVDVNPLLNAVDTTNGYVLDKQQLENIPTPTGSFTGVAILSPGVNAELPSGTGANDGLGNLPVWANGQRDTSNSFSLNGVDGTSLFNGKSTSQVGSARVVNSTGVSSSNGGGGAFPSVASVYLSIGNAIPTPAPETVQEVRVNASMYDASQGSTSGAHIDLSTSSGTNAYHGTVYAHRGTNWINAAPFFFKQDADVPAYNKNPELHRYIVGGTFGGPIIKNKLFGFVAYQHLHVSDQYIGDSFFDVPWGLSDSNRTAAGIAAYDNANFSGNCCASGNASFQGSDIDPTVVKLFNSPALPGEPGKWLIPNAGTATLGGAQQLDAFLPGTARFKSDQAVANLDYNATSKDTIRGGPTS